MVMRKAGIMHPLMDEIEELFGVNGCRIQERRSI